MITQAEKALGAIIRAWDQCKMGDIHSLEETIRKIGDALTDNGFADEERPNSVGLRLVEQADEDHSSPVAVLRAMAASYAKAWIDESDDEDWEGYLYAVREALRECISSGSPGYMPQRIADDYEARRIGARGMNDHPLGAS